MLSDNATLLNWGSFEGMKVDRPKLHSICKINLFNYSRCKVEFLTLFPQTNLVYTLTIVSASIQTEILVYQLATVIIKLTSNRYRQKALNCRWHQVFYVIQDQNVHILVSTLPQVNI